MGEMAMPGGWTMSMMWMRMPGQTWLGAGAEFVGTWTVMMVAMMMPALVPMLWRFRGANASSDITPQHHLTVLVGAGYFFVWAVLGALIFPVGVALANVTMAHESLARAVPIAAGVAVALAGALQLARWKSHHLACCRELPRRGGTLPADAGTAWRHGLRLGVHCACASAPGMAILLCLGVMELHVMTIVAIGITAERLAPNGLRVARFLGAVAIAGGLFLIIA